MLFFLTYQSNNCEASVPASHLDRIFLDSGTCKTTCTSVPFHGISVKLAIQTLMPVRWSSHTDSRSFGLEYETCFAFMSIKNSSMRNIIPGL